MSTAAAAAQPASSSSSSSASYYSPTNFGRDRISVSMPKVKRVVTKGKGANKAAQAAARQELAFSLSQSIALCQALSHATFDETISLAVRLNLDPRKPNQSVRGAAALPHGTGKRARVAVFAKGDKAAEARAAGADIVGDKDLADQILAGEINFDRCIATPDVMAIVGRVARVLGPRGLMPNPKVGTVTADVASAVSAAKAGSVEFKTDKHGVIHAPIGKVSFTRQALEANATAFVEKLIDMKPSGAPKGLYILSAHISSTQGTSGVAIDTKLAPFKTSTSASVAAKDGVVTPASLGAYGRIHSPNGFRVVRYDLGSFPDPSLIESAAGKWHEVRQTIKESRKTNEPFLDVVDKIQKINTSAPIPKARAAGASTKAAAAGKSKTKASNMA